MTDIFIEKFINYKKGRTSDVPFKFNVLQLQQGSIVENSHSNILVQLLKYKDSNGHIFAESLLQRLGIHVSLKSNVEFKREENRIDCLIYSIDDFVIIIENKINGASCGKNQLSNYYNKILKDKEKKYFNVTKQKDDRINKTWIVFLTFDGGHPNRNDINSLIRIGVLKKDENSNYVGKRYVEANYREHIIPWLINDVLPLIPRKDEDLYTGVYQYLKFFEKPNKTELSQSIDWFRNNFKNIITNDLLSTNRNLHNCLKRIDKYKKFKYLDNGNDIRNELRGIVYSLIEEPMKDFIDITNDFFAFSDKLHINFHPTFYYINILYWGKKDLSISLGWDCLGMKVLAKGRKVDYELQFVIKGKQEKMKEAKNIIELIKNNGFNKQEHIQGKCVYRKLIHWGETPFLKMEPNERIKKLKDVYNKETSKDLIIEINNFFEMN